MTNPFNQYIQWLSTFNTTYTMLISAYMMLDKYFKKALFCCGQTLKRAILKVGRGVQFLKNWYERSTVKISFESC